ncbi:MAG: hypothetical protein IKK11_01295, partial [Oscillospiraceae bacterium]|nr:hypothetical protein [Oscillospiraceae bacterium]
NLIIENSIVKESGEKTTGRQFARYANVTINDSKIVTSGHNYVFIYTTGEVNNTTIISDDANYFLYQADANIASLDADTFYVDATSVIDSDNGKRVGTKGKLVAHVCAQFPGALQPDSTDGEHTAVEVPGKDATCAEPGYTAGTKCSVCGVVISGMEEIGTTSEHTWGDWEVITNATCGVAGEQKHTCSVCGAEETAPIDATGVHTPAEDDGDCTTEVICTVCGGVAIPASAGHVAEEDDGDVSTAVKCQNCDVIVVEAIDAVAEIWKDGALVGHLEADDTLGDVINAGDIRSKGYTIKLLKDAELITKTNVTITAATVFDLNGHKLTMGETGYLYVQANLTFTDSTSSGELYITGPSGDKTINDVNAKGKHIFAVNKNAPVLTFENIKVTLRDDYAGSGAFISISEGITGATFNFTNVDFDVVKLRSMFLYGSKEVANYVNISDSTFDFEDANETNFLYAVIVDIQDTTIVADNGNRVFSFATGTVSNTDITVTEFQTLSMTYYDEKEEHMPWLKEQGLPTTLTFDKECSLNGGQIQDAEGYETFVHVCSTVENVTGGTYYGEHVAGEPVEEEGFMVTYCTVCNKEVSREALACQHGALAKTDAVAADCDDAGCAEYWYCSDCDVYFADESAETEIEDFDAWKAEGGAGYVA